MKNQATKATASIILDIIATICLYLFIPYEPQYHVPTYYGMFYFVIAFFLMDILESLVQLYTFYYPIKKLHNSEREMFEQAIATKEIYDELPKIENEVLMDSPLYDEDLLGCYSCKHGNLLGGNTNACLTCRHQIKELAYSSHTSNYERISQCK